MLRWYEFLRARFAHRRQLVRHVRDAHRIVDDMRDPVAGTAYSGERRTEAAMAAVETARAWIGHAIAALETEQEDRARDAVVQREQLILEARALRVDDERDRELLRSLRSTLHLLRARVSEAERRYVQAVGTSSADVVLDLVVGKNAGVLLADLFEKMTVLEAALEALIETTTVDTILTPEFTEHLDPAGTLTRLKGLIGRFRAER